MENSISVKNTGLKWGFILGLMTTIVSLIVSLFELYGSSSAVQIVSLVLVLAALILAIQEYKSNNEGFLSFGEGFGLSMIILSISAVFSNVMSYIYMKFIDSSMISKIKDLQIIEMENQGMSDEEIDTAMQFAEFFMTPEMLAIVAFVVYLFFGAIIAMVLSLIFKKDRPVQF